jgi:hypothetical protein
MCHICTCHAQECKKDYDYVSVTICDHLWLFVTTVTKTATFELQLRAATFAAQLWASLMNNLTRTLGEAISIPCIRFEFTPARSSWMVQQLQYPLRLAYATTFHGCVGLILDKTVIDTRSDVFSHGQLYTSISHVRNRNDSRVLCNEHENADPMHLHITTNVVYRELLS